MLHLIETIKQYLAVDHMSLGPSALSGYLTDVRAALLDACSALKLMEAKVEYARLSLASQSIAAESTPAPVQAREETECESPVLQVVKLPSPMPDVTDLDAALDLRRRYEIYMAGRKRGWGPEYEELWIEAFRMTEKNGAWSAKRAARILTCSESGGMWILQRKYRNKMKSASR